MKTISVQQMPNGYEIEPPSFAYWLKAGIAFTLGGGIVTLAGLLVWAVLGLGMMTGVVRSLITPTHYTLKDTRTLPH